MALSGKASEHMNMRYKQFKPMNRLPMSFTATGQIDKMKQMIRTFVSGSAGKVRSIQNAMQWIESGFNVETIPKQAIDELSELAKVA